MIVRKNCSSCDVPMYEVTCCLCRFRDTDHGEIGEAVPFLEKNGWSTIPGRTVTAPKDWRCPRCTKRANERTKAEQGKSSETLHPDER